MEDHQNCPNCGRNLTEDEVYCYFCETELAEASGKNKKNTKKESTEKQK